MTLVEALLTAIGALTSALIWVTLRYLQALKDCAAEKQTLQNARLDDQKAATEALLKMNDKTHAALDKVAEVLEAVRHQPAQPFQVNPIGMTSPRSPGGE